MKLQKCTKTSFSVIGKLGSTNDGEGFIKALWNETNEHFNEVEFWAKKDNQGNLFAMWGLMSDFSKSFKPWEDNFTKGLYLAGVEVIETDDKIPSGFVKWTVPSAEYLYIKVDGDYMTAFKNVLTYMNENNIELVGAVFDYICPKENGQLYLFFPIKLI